MEAFAGQCHLTELQNAPKSKNIQLAVEYINAHYAEQLSLEQVAASVYLNPDYFSRAFKMETGQTFVNYDGCQIVTVCLVVGKYGSACTDDCTAGRLL